MSRTTGRRRPRPTMLAGVLCVAMLAAAGAAPVAAGVPGGSITSGTGVARVSGLSGSWSLSLHAGSSGPSYDLIALEVRKRNATGSARSEDTWRVVQASVSCTQKLSSCTIDDDGAMGTYGRVDLVFTPTKPRTTRDLRCIDSDVVYATEARRKGKVTGTLRLDTKSALIGTIRNGSGAHRTPAAIPFVITRTTYTGAACPEVDSCRDSVWLSSDEQVVYGYRPLPTGPAQVGIQRTLASLEPDVEREQGVIARGPGAAILTFQTAATLAGATVGMDALSPFVVGSITFTQSAPLTPGEFLGCESVGRGGQVTLDVTLRMPGRPKVAIDQVVGAELNRTPD